MSSLSRAGSIVGIMTLLSRVLGFVRDQVLAIVFGAGAMAFKIPNFLRRLFAEGAFAQAFIPVFTEYRETKSPEALRELAAHVAGTLTIVLLIVTTTCVMLAPFMVMLFAPGFSDDPVRFELATQMLRITFPYLLFVSLLAYAGSMLNTFGRFAIPAFTPVLLNICMICGALFFSPYFETPIVALAWSVLAAGILQLLLQLPFLAQIGLLPMPRWGWKHSGVRRILKLMAPAVVGSSVAQINLLLDTIIASFLMAGSISWLYYSDRLMEFPLGLLGVTLGTIILPRLSREHAQQAPEQFQRTVSWALRLTVVAGLPAAIGLMMLAEPMLITLFHYGEFKAHDATMASYSLIAYSAGLPAFLMIKIFAPAFFARQDTRTPVRIGIIALISNMAYNLLLVLPMIWLDFMAPHVGLALATSLSAWQQALMLYQKLKADDIYQAPPELAGFTLRTLPGLCLMALLLWWFTHSDLASLDAGRRVSWLLGMILAGAACYGASLAASGIRPRHLASP